MLFLDINLSEAAAFFYHVCHFFFLDRMSVLVIGLLRADATDLNWPLILDSVLL
jgi:hypothetical protein